MAATGGGKIRSRRYHIASKPYAKTKQQSGLISRVTDTVKSIVPSWLQKYFKNGDAPEEEAGGGGGGGVPVDMRENCQTPPLPPNGSEQGPPSLDGRSTPEPSTSNAEPSNSRASLNFQDYVLSRPPLSRSHLHFPPLEASSPTLGAPSGLICQPSTSSASGPFSTGCSLVKEIKDNLSQHEDDNISTTSGFSSRASDKDVPTSKTASLPQLWSPEMDRTISVPQPSQSGLKRPAFNLSVFGTSANSTLNRTVLNSSQLGDSPFYPGKTTYGGAAAVKSLRTRPGTPYQAPVRRQIKAKPACAQPCGVTSATARRILQSLERMSSPLADAKRIPAAASPLSTSMDGANLDVSHFQSKKKRLDANLPPVQKLVVPAALPSSANRSVSFRPSLTPGGFSRTLDRTPRDAPPRQSPLPPDRRPRSSQCTAGSSRGPAYPMSSTPAASSSSGGGKMKRERTSTRPSSKHMEDDEVAEVPDLPTISLPISTSALPAFSFSSPQPPLTTSSASSACTASSITVTLETVASPPCVPFTFSSPIVKANPASPPAFSPTAGFTFSAPVAKLGPSLSNGKLATPIATAIKSAGTEDFKGPFKPAKTLKQGSVLDLLKAPGFASTPAQNSSSSDGSFQKTSTQSIITTTTTTTTTTTSSSSSVGLSDVFKAPAGWSCDVCLVQNKPTDTKCICCTVARPSPSASCKAASVLSSALKSSTANSTSSTEITSPFSKPAGTWECDTCLVINKADAVKCVACETAKPGTGLKPPASFSSAFSAVKTVPNPSAPAPTTPFAGFGEFKKPEGAWECDVCLVQNKAEDTKCIACTSAKPGAPAGASSAASRVPLFGFGDKFKKPENAWDCDVCLLQNKAADVTCVACQAAKPGAQVEPKALGSSSGETFGSSTSSSGGFTFGTSKSTSLSGSGGITFGVATSESSSFPSGGFKFGIPFGSAPSESASKDTSSSLGFKFSRPSEGFKFGVSSGDEKKPELSATASQVKFGSGGGIMFGTGSSSTESISSKSTFSFGLAKPEEKAPDATTTPSVTVAPPASSSSSSTASASDSTSTSTTTTTTTAGSVFGRLGEPAPTTSTPPGVPTFGSLSAETKPPPPAFTFGKPEEKKEVPATFLFGGASKDAEAAPANSGGFPFGKPSAPAEQATPTFTFGKPADKSDALNSEAPKPTFTFGQAAAASDAPKAAFSFLTSNPPSTSSGPAPTASLFGSSISTQAAPAPTAAPSTFMFGQSAAATSDAPPAKAFVFGQNQDGQPPVPVNSTLVPSQPFVFGARASAAPPAAPSINFGGSAPPAASPAAPNPFLVSSSTPAEFGASQAPAFGSSFASPFPSATSHTPTFGGKPTAAPVFGQQANPNPAFGAAANSAQGAGFQFGGAGAFGSSNSTGVFTFGAGAAASPGPAASPALAPQSGAPGGGFNFSQPLAFNIGSSKSFTPSPAGQTIGGRKIKTAVRRRRT
ncbi:nuclear pore complex protein Nup153 isoform X2 [Dunckerocampus dactyliophorus]|uniref:nuclear pore complex protein Nup153 isoform X2 n=1 Tax=Dunckerocampus dactyliophorus TaxID=161453 RepID=UPI00240733D4|nr:nuclear pore complex protein Nup153 isoform X2 [Dunckerocampus dactyliophorus]